MRVAVTGASGAIGTALEVRLRGAGHDVVALVRDRSLEGEGRFFWNPAAGEIDHRVWDGTDAVVHLAGRSLVSGRWNESLKREIRESRVRGTALVAASMARADRSPRTLVTASAVGYYGSGGEAGARTEDSPAGRGFLAELCADWEAAAAPAAEVGVRVVPLRIGLVLDVLLAKLAPLFRVCLGGRLGDGRQVMSWITMDDLTGAILFLLDYGEIAGPVNAVAPEAAGNAAFTAVLGRALRRPALLPVPAFALRLVLGREMADETVLSDIHAVPARLGGAGFAFRHPTLEEAVRAVLRPQAADWPGDSDPRDGNRA